ncbi:MAG: hypothetical protein ACREIP_09100 [Alphaproteobacteria bacterium]
MLGVRFCRFGAARKARLASPLATLLASAPFAALRFAALPLFIVSAFVLAAPDARAATDGDPLPPPPTTDDPPLVLIAPIGLEAVAVVSQVITGNVIGDINNTRSTLVDNSYIGSRGIHQLNQDAGRASNQANMLLLTLGAGAGNVFQDSVILAAHTITGNTLTLEGGSRTNTIQNSFDNAQGYIQVNQNSGTLNAQANIGIVSLGAGVGNAFVVMSDTTLGGVVSNNTFNTNDTTPKSDVINGGFNGFRGVAQITQSSGDGNAITNALAISVTVLNVQ